MFPKRHSKDFFGCKNSCGPFNLVSLLRIPKKFTRHILKQLGNNQLREGGKIGKKDRKKEGRKDDESETYKGSEGGERGEEEVSEADSDVVSC